MIIQDILQKRVSAFELENQKLKKLFSFYLHLAPTIDSRTAASIPDERLLENWNAFKATLPQNSFAFIAPNCKIETYFQKYNLLETSEVNRRKKAFVCKKMDSKETEYQCLLRHLRNAIAHSNVFLEDTGNRKYILFEDYGGPKNTRISARIFLSQTDLSLLKKQIMA